MYSNVLSHHHVLTSLLSLSVLLQILGQLVTIIREGWDTDPARRPSSLNIKKRIASLLLHH